MASPEELFPAELSQSDLLTFKEKLAKLPMIGPPDLVRLARPSIVKEDADLVQKLIARTTPEEIRVLNRAYVLRLREVWETNPQYSHLEWEKFRDTRLENFAGVWVQDLESDQLQRRTLDKEEYFQTLTSRLYPMLSKSEIARIRQATGVFFGLSTGLPVLKALAQLGLGNVIGIDPDVVNLSNIRMGIGDTDVGIHKSVYTAYQLVQINPHADFQMFPRVLSQEEIETAVGTADFIVEMIDNFLVKRAVRETARKFGKTVFMGTGTGWQPVIAHEKLGDPLFLRTDLRFREGRDFISKTANAIKVIGLKNIPLRQMVNFILGALDRKLEYWCQIGPTASGTAYGLAFAIVQHLNGNQLRNEQAINLPTLLMTPEGIIKSDEKYFLELKQDFPDIFTGFQTLQEAVTSLYHQIFEEGN